MLDMALDKGKGEARAADMGTGKDWGEAQDMGKVVAEDMVEDEVAAAVAVARFRRRHDLFRADRWSLRHTDWS